MQLLQVPEHLNGENGLFRNPNSGTWNVSSDLEAIRLWLNLYLGAGRVRTHEAYQRELERFYLWCIVVQKKALSSIDTQDALAFQAFLRAIPGLVDYAILGKAWFHTTEEKRWIQEQVEGASTKLDPTEQRHILDRMNAAEAIEKFLATKWMGQKRFGLEGAESTIAILDAILDRSADQQMAGAVLGMAHRGRLNVLVNIVGKSYGQLFKEFEGHVDPDSIQGSGDVKYHLGTSADREFDGNTVHLSLTANPSHLEVVDPVVLGKVRAKQDQLNDTTDRMAVLPILLHGDAAFAGRLAGLTVARVGHSLSRAAGSSCSPRTTSATSHRGARSSLPTRRWHRA